MCQPIPQEGVSVSRIDFTPEDDIPDIPSPVYRPYYQGYDQWEQNRYSGQSRYSGQGYVNYQDSTRGPK